MLSVVNNKQSAEKNKKLQKKTKKLPSAVSLATTVSLKDDRGA